MLKFGVDTKSGSTDWIWDPEFSEVRMAGDIRKFSGNEIRKFRTLQGLDGSGKWSAGEIQNFMVDAKSGCSEGGQIRKYRIDTESGIFGISEGTWHPDCSEHIIRKSRGEVTSGNSRFRREHEFRIRVIMTSGISEETRHPDVQSGHEIQEFRGDVKSGNSRGSENRRRDKIRSFEWKWNPEVRKCQRLSGSGKWKSWTEFWGTWVGSEHGMK